MNYTKNEKRLRGLLSFISIIFLLGGAGTAYYFFFIIDETQLLLLFTPPALLILFLFSLLASKGVRKNYVFVDLLLLSFFITAVSTAILYFTSENNTYLYGIYCLAALVLFIITLFTWRKAVTGRFELKELSPAEALAYRALAEVIIGDYKTEGYSFDTIVKDFDSYLNKFNSKQKCSVRMIYLVVQFFPLLFLNVPLTWMGIEDRKEFIKRRFFKAKGISLTVMRSAKQLIYFIYYSSELSFKSTGYKIFEDRQKFKEMPIEPDPEPLNVIYIREDKDIQTDICVIGSGAAGAVAAYNLAKNTGKKVTILEKGKYFIPQKDFTNVEPEMIGLLYKDGALEMTQDFDLAVLQGICLGGSTTINNGICFRTPHSILDQWEKLDAKIDVDKLDNYFTNIEKIIGAVPLKEKIVSGGSNKFFEGAGKLNMKPEWFVTNFGECGGSGYCNLGCKYNRKLSVLLNYLPMAQKEGVEIIAGADVLNIKTEGRNATKIKCKSINGASFTVSAKHIVIAAGAIASSVILLKSGIKRNVGKRLSFNITTPMMAEFPDVINSFDGVQMCCYVKGEGYLVETTFNPPGTSALVMQGWFEELNKRMNNYNRFATAAPVVGSEPNGKIKLSLFGSAIIDYNMSDGDFRKLKEGMKTLSRVFLAAGAKCILPSSYDNIVITNEADLSNIDSMIARSSDISLSSAHPQGGNPLSDNIEIGAVDSNFRVHGFDNIYVCDASIFPTGVMVNPQLSIMGLANYAADKISENI